jgi:hypothetical protein
MTTTEERSETQYEPFTAPVFWNELIRRHEEKNGHFFDDDTMRFHNSLLHGTPLVGPDGYVYAVVSSQAPSTGDPLGRPGRRTEEPRQYQVIRCAPDGSVERPHPEENPHGEFALRFTDKDAAFHAADVLAGPADPTTAEFADLFRWY